jgi:hypothetical protein
MTHSVVSAIKQQRTDTPERSCHVLRVPVTGTPAVSAHANENVCIKNVLFSEGKLQLQDICYTITGANEFSNLQIKCV